MHSKLQLHTWHIARAGHDANAKCNCMNESLVFLFRLSADSRSRHDDDYYRPRYDLKQTTSTVCQQRSADSLCLFTQEPHVGSAWMYINNIHYIQTQSRFSRVYDRYVLPSILINIRAIRHTDDANNIVVDAFVVNRALVLSASRRFAHVR